MAAKQPYAEVVWLDAERAMKWHAAKPDTERRLSSARVHRYKRAMERGDWVLTWDAIAFDRRGKRINGQHRLEAFLLAVQAKPTLRIQVLALYDLPPVSVAEGDQGAKRTTAQVLEMRGEEQAGALAAALRYVWQWHNGHEIGSRASEAAPSATEALRVLDQQPDIRDHVSYGRSVRRQALVGSDGLSIALVHLFNRADPDQARAFFDSLCTGTDLDAGDPILHVRTAFVKLRGQTSRSKGIDARHKAFILIAAFNAWRRGETWARVPSTSRLYAFPEIEPAGAAVEADAGV